MADATQNVTLTVNGIKIAAAKGTLLIEACKQNGIEIPAFCYYPGLSLQGACRMCLVEIEKMPKMQTACTTPVAEGMVVQTESEKVVQARKSTLEMLLANHPLDCPVCDAGGECELQDMTFKYGAGESKFIDIKSHRDEQQWSPVVFYDRPRCILCYRCVRVCGEGMDVWALGIQNRGQGSVIAPNQGDSLDCEECGMCIDICPVGALTSGSYRYKTRPWEMTHVGTVCNHCGDGCLTTVGVRRSDTGSEIVRCDNRDRSGINDDFLCIKGRYAYDFAANPERVTTPLIKRDGKFVAATWTEAIELVAASFQQILLAGGPQAIGVIGSNRTTNEENYLLQKFARTVLGTNNIDHHRTADFPSFASAIAANHAQTASMSEVATAPAILLIGSDPTEAASAACLADSQRRAPAQRPPLRGQRQPRSSSPTRQRIFATVAAGAEGSFAGFLNGNEAEASQARRRARSARKTARRARRRKQSHHRVWSRAAWRMQSTRWSPTAHRKAQGSFALPITRTRAARPTWDSTPICSLATAPYPAPHARRLPGPPTSRPIRAWRSRRCSTMPLLEHCRHCGSWAQIPPPGTRTAKRFRGPSSSCRICSSPKRRATPTCSCPPPLPMRRPAR